MLVVDGTQLGKRQRGNGGDDLRSCCTGDWQGRGEEGAGGHDPSGEVLDKTEDKINPLRTTARPEGTMACPLA